MCTAASSPGEVVTTGSGRIFYEPTLSEHFGGGGGTPTITRVANSWWEVQF